MSFFSVVIALFKVNPFSFSFNFVCSYGLLGRPKAGYYCSLPKLLGSFMTFSELGFGLQITKFVKHVCIIDSAHTLNACLELIFFFYY